MNRAKLGDLCVLNYGKSLRNYQSELDKELIVRVYGTNGAIGWTNSALCEYPTIIIGRKGAYRGVNFSSSPSWTIDTAYYLTLRNDDIDLKWLYYRLLTVDINSMDTGSAIPSTKREDFYSVSINIPPQISQKRIANILSAYDDLIENNRRRIRLLERSLHLLYKEWFVHLRFPSHEHSKIVDGIPEGWKTGTVADFYKTSSGGTPSRKRPEFFTGEINWVKTQELNEGFIFSSDEKITEEAVKCSSAKVFPEETVLVAMYGATIGQTAILAVPAATNQACCGIIPNYPNAHYIHAFLFFRENKQGLMNLSQGSAQNNISQEIIKTYPMVLPTKMLMAQFVDYSKPVFRQIKNLSLQNRQLQQARDLLLPKLMSGAIGV
jgi:type I restriction enzyme S subunit